MLHRTMVVFVGITWNAVLACAQEPVDGRLSDVEVAAQLRSIASKMASVDKLLKDLSSTDFTVREATTRRLMELPLVPLRQLQAMAIDTDPETRFRIQQILARPAPATSDLTMLVAAIHERKIPGLAPDVLIILQYSSDEKLRWSFEQALLATSRAEDVEHLTNALRSHVVAVRCASLNALAGLRTDAAIAALLAHEHETDEQARLAQGEGLIKLGRKEGLAMLIDLIASRNQEVRTRAAVDLQSVTGRLDDSLFAASNRERDASVAAWKTWLASQKDLRLRPLEATNTVVSPFED